MKKISGKILLVDDEQFECDVLEMALKELAIQVDLVYCTNGEDAFNYLKSTDDTIFMIICDMNMPKMNGIDLKKTIDHDKGLKAKAVPFIFSSTAATKAQLEEAYDYRLQGYFIKPSCIDSMAKQMEIIINYWSISIRPDSNL